MIVDTQGCVIDASTAVKIFLPEALSNQAVVLFEEIEQLERLESLIYTFITYLISPPIPASHCLN